MRGRLWGGFLPENPRGSQVEITRYGLSHAIKAGPLIIDNGGQDYRDNSLQNETNIGAREKG